MTPDYSSIARLVSAIGAHGFPGQLVDFAAGLVPAGAAMILVYRADGPPEVVLDRLAEAERPVLYGDYLSGVYRLSPFYRASVGLDRPAVRRLADVAPGGFRQSVYFAKYFSRIGVSDLMGALLPLEGLGVLHLSLSRAEGGAGFSRAERDRLAAALPLLAACCARHWRVEPPRSPDPPASLAGASLAARLPELTAREAGIVEAMLAGHSAKSAARLLGISAETVRVHRKHVYAKLAVRSQAELFSLYLKRLRGPA